MPRPVFPVVRLPYDRPDRVARVLDAIRCELRAAGCARRPTAMTARVLNAARGEPEKSPPQVCIAAVPAAAVGATVIDVQAAVDHVTVGVRDCTLTPKARPEITVTAGGAAARNVYLDNTQNHRRPAPADDDVSCGGSYLLVPPVNVTAEISRPPLTSRYAATS